MLKRKADATTAQKEPNKKKTTPTKGVQTFLTAWVKAPSEANDTEGDSASTAKTVKPLTFEELTNGLSEEKKKLLRLEADTMEGGWLKAMSAELKKPYFINLKEYLQTEKESSQKIFPPENQIYSWSKFTPLSLVKVVIVGQDPYHDDGQAHGLCFSVQDGVRSPPSLHNIYKALKQDFPTFQIPNHGNLTNWAKQGVLLLNASLTVRAHNAASHSGKGWETFTDAVIQYLNERKSGLVFMLWGSHAQKKGKTIDKTKHLVLRAAHPSPLSAHRGFFECRHWSQANQYLKSIGKEPVNWDCL